MFPRDAIILMDSTPLYCDILILPYLLKHKKVIKISPKVIHAIFFDDIIRIVVLCLTVIYMPL